MRAGWKSGFIGIPRSVRINCIIPFGKNHHQESTHANIDDLLQNCTKPVLRRIHGILFWRAINVPISQIVIPAGQLIPENIKNTLMKRSKSLDSINFGTYNCYTNYNIITWRRLSFVLKGSVNGISNFLSRKRQPA
jgi:hypothetical protein